MVCSDEVCSAVWKLFQVPSGENVLKVPSKLQKSYLTPNICGPNQAWMDILQNFNLPLVSFPA